MAKKKPTSGQEQPPKHAPPEVQGVETEVQLEPVLEPAAEAEPGAEKPAMPGVYSLSDAHALPELSPDDAEAIAADPYEPPSERGIGAFKDADDRTMLVGFTNGRLFKTLKQ